MSYKFGILGVGKMGSAILNGVVNSNIYPKNEIALYVRNDEQKSKLISDGYNLVNSENELFELSDMILLSIKPQQFESVFNNLEKREYKNKTIISIAPGKTIEYLESVFSGAIIVRAMPNTPALINEATTTIASNNTSSDGFIKALEIFNSIGKSVVVEEYLIDEAIPLNGSMPAYIFSFIKEMIENGVNHGLEYSDAKDLAISAIKGSISLIESSNDDVDTLINNVCSKGGTTIAGLNKMYENGFKESIKECYDACVKRSKEIK